jgi:hypothetical protein
VIGTNVSGEAWFEKAMATGDGGEFAVDDISRATKLGDAPVATYSTAIRAGGETHGEAIGALGIFFDWGPQAQGIVEGVRMSDDDKERTRVMLLDASGTVIASSDGRGILSERITLRSEGRATGFYSEAGRVIGFALTPGYETYEGLGWYGAIVQNVSS